MSGGKSQYIVYAAMSRALAGKRVALIVPPNRVRDTRRRIQEVLGNVWPIGLRVRSP